jgi:Pentapeptide repeats (8 copies)
MAQEQQTPGERALELIRLLLPNWQPTTQDVLRWIRLALAVGLVILGGLFILDVIGLLFGITLLSLLKVLAIPITVGAAVPLLNWLQKRRELEVDNHRRQEDGLQAYLDQMTQLLLDKNLRSNSKANSEARTAARAGTLTTLEIIHHPDKKGIIVKFLWECSLLKKQGAEDAVVTLEGANLKGAKLGEAKLGEAKLTEADLHGADLHGADLIGADLTDTDLTNADLTDAKVTKEQLEQAKSLQGATMPNGQKYEDWLKSKSRGEDRENGGPS